VKTKNKMEVEAYIYILRESWSYQKRILKIAYTWYLKQNGRYQTL
jgi:hypothetical protein